jgi:hypothetical protein
MTKYLKKYTQEIEKILKDNENKTDWEKVLENHRVQIGFLQHERLIHLLVTLTFGIGFLVTIAVALAIDGVVLGMASILLLILLVPYIFHYFKLENGVQKLYWLDKEIQKKI